jgi:hypothetical protein
MKMKFEINTQGLEIPEIDWDNTFTVAYGDKHRSYIIYNDTLNTALMVKWDYSMNSVIPVCAFGEYKNKINFIHDTAKELIGLIHDNFLTMVDEIEDTSCKYLEDFLNYLKD